MGSECCRGKGGCNPLAMDVIPCNHSSNTLIITTTCSDCFTTKCFLESPFGPSNIDGEHCAIQPHSPPSLMQEKNLFLQGENACHAHLFKRSSWERPDYFCLSFPTISPFSHISGCVAQNPVPRAPIPHPSGQLLWGSISDIRRGVESAVIKGVCMCAIKAERVCQLVLPGGGGGAIKQRIQSSHIPPCHRHIVIATTLRWRNHHSHCISSLVRGICYEQSRWSTMYSSFTWHPHLHSFVMIL